LAALVPGRSALVSVGARRFPKAERRCAERAGAAAHRDGLFLSGITETAGHEGVDVRGLASILTYVVARARHRLRATWDPRWRRGSEGYFFEAMIVAARRALSPPRLR
jgi:hypothetical protein